MRTVHTLVIALTLTLLATRAPLASAQPVRPASIDVTKVIHWVPMGGGSDPVRMMPPGMAKGGYTAVDREMVAPAVRLGCKRILLWHPGGMTPPSGMDFDQMLLMEEDKRLNPNLSIEAFLRVFGKYPDQGVRLMIYLGTPHWSKGMLDVRGCSLEEAAKPDAPPPPRQWYDRFDASVAPFLALKADIMIDATNQLTPTKFPHEYHALRKLQGQMAAYGGRLWVEPAMPAWDVAWSKCPGMISMRQVKDHTPKPRNRPECLAFQQDDHLGKELVDDVAAALGAGYTASCNVLHLAAALKRP